MLLLLNADIFKAGIAEVVVVGQGPVQLCDPIVRLQLLKVPTPSASLFSFWRKAIRPFEAGWAKVTFAVASLAFAALLGRYRLSQG